MHFGYKSFKTLRDCDLEEDGDQSLKAEKQKGVANKELLANLYQHLLEECLTAEAADMNRPNYCPVNSSIQVAGQAYLFVYTICNASGRSASLWRP